RALARGRRVKISTGPASRAALAAAGKAAATVGTTIHLPTALTTSPEHQELISHELTHVAAAPDRSTPRFFEDEHHDAEEQQARDTGRVIGAVARGAVGGVVPTGGTGGLPVGGGTNLFQALSSAGASPGGAAAARSIGAAASG